MPDQPVGQSERSPDEPDVLTIDLDVMFKGRYTRLVVTDAMVARAEKMWMLWKAPSPGHEDTGRQFMRAVLDAALNGADHDV